MNIKNAIKMRRQKMTRRTKKRKQNDSFLDQSLEKDTKSDLKLGVLQMLTGIVQTRKA